MVSSYESSGHGGYRERAGRGGPLLAFGLVARNVGEVFPWGTMAVNVLGSFLIGLIFFLTEGGGRLQMDPLLRQTLMLGVLGGFTTFSSFSLQTLQLMRAGEWGA
jgi:CrcB protein